MPPPCCEQTKLVPVYFPTAGAGSSRLREALKGRSV